MRIKLMNTVSETSFMCKPHNNFGAVRQQAITSAGVDRDLCLHMVPLAHNEFIYLPVFKSTINMPSY